MTMEEFLSLPNPERYDFSNDGASEKYQSIRYQSIRDVIEKYFVYKAFHEKGWTDGDKSKYENGIVYPGGFRYSKWAKGTYKPVPDPDTGSDLLQEIYRILWRDTCEARDESDEKGNYIVQKDGRICADTLNSAQITLNSTIKKFNKGKYCEPKGRYSINYAITIFAKEEIRGKFSDELGDIPGLVEFLSVYHTLGNFIPVPVDCNSHRGLGKTKDYWDLALRIIYDYYAGKCDTAADNKPDPIADIVGNDADRIKRYKDWLKFFGTGADGWQSFVRKNYLQDFVNITPDGKYGEPKELWTNHFSCLSSGRVSGSVCPQTKDGTDDDEQFYTNASSWILARGRRMIAALKKRQVYEVLLCPIACSSIRDTQPYKKGGVIFSGQRYRSRWDPDMSDFAVEFYKIIYKEIFEELLDESGRLLNCCFAGDTMNSFNSIANITPGAGKSKKFRTPRCSWPLELRNYEAQYHCLANFWVIPMCLGRTSKKKNMFDSMDIFLNLLVADYDSVLGMHGDYIGKIGNFALLEATHFLGAYNPIRPIEYCEEKAYLLIEQATGRIKKRAEDLAKSEYSDALWEYFNKLGLFDEIYAYPQKSDKDVGQDK